MSIETRVAALATALGTDVGALLSSIGTLSSLTTAEKGNIVAAINEVVTAANAASGIDDAATATGTTWSSSKISTQLSSAISTLATGAPDLLNSIDEIAAALEDNPDLITALRGLITTNATALSTLATNVGDTDTDYVAAYTTAKTA